MKRDFIPQDPLSEFDYLFDKNLSPHKEYTGKVMLIADGYYQLYCQNVPGADETDPLTWVPAQPATDNQSSVKYRIGQTVNIKFFDADFSFASIYGLNRDYEEPLIDDPTKDILHENSPIQSLQYDRVANKYTIRSGAGKVELATASAKLSVGSVSLEVTPTAIIVSNGVLTFNIFTHTHISAAPTNPTSPPVAGS